MKKQITQKEFDRLPIVDWKKQCPGNIDYSLIKRFENCNFGNNCNFSEHSTFDYECSFGKYCNFSNECSFEDDCNFGAECWFSEYCNFGVRCNFDDDCSFRSYCKFDEYCIFGMKCNFNDCTFDRFCTFYDGCIFSIRCVFGDGCLFNRRCSFGGKKCTKTNPIMRINYIGSRNDGATFINTDDGIYVQCGCFFGSVDEFVRAVKQKHAGTVHEKTYLLAVDIAKVKFGL